MSSGLAIGNYSGRLRVTEESESSVLKVLEKYFHYSCLRPGQLEAVQPVQICL